MPRAQCAEANPGIGNTDVQSCTSAQVRQAKNLRGPEKRLRPDQAPLSGGAAKEP